MGAFNKERNIYDSNPTSGTFLRGIVVDREDPRMEARVAVHIPRLMPKGDPHAVKLKEDKVRINDDTLINKEAMDLVSKEVTTSNAMWARPINKPHGSYEVPYVGQTVYLLMEDGDPNKLYYFGVGPTIAGDNPEMYYVEAVADTYTPDKKPNVHLLYEFLDRMCVYYNENLETREFRINLPNKTLVSIHENETDISIELKTTGGHKIYVSDKIAAGITLSTSGGSSVIMSGDGANIKLTNNAGAVTDMAGAQITHSAGGGKIVIGGGKVKIN